MKNVNDAMRRKLARVLQEAGGIYELADILELIFQKKMQSWVVGDSWAVTQVLDFPRRRVLEIFMAVGQLSDMAELERQIQDFAKAEQVTLMVANGRRGFLKTGKSLGWRPRLILFTKEIGR